MVQAIMMEEQAQAVPERHIEKGAEPGELDKDDVR